MALEVAMTGSGSIGDLAPGWTVNESATPVAIGDVNAGTGTVSFAARATDESLLVINNDAVSTINDLGTLNGVVQSVNETGISASVTHGTVLDSFNLDVAMPPLIGGDVVSAVDYFEQKVIGNPRTTKTNNLGVSNQFFTMSGHGYSFIQDANGLASFQEPTATTETISYVGTGSEIVDYTYVDIRNQLSCDSFLRFNGNVYGNNVDGGMFYSEPVGGANLTATFTATIGASATFTYSGGFIKNNDQIAVSTTGTLPQIAGTIAISSARTLGTYTFKISYTAIGHRIESTDTITFSGFSYSAYNGTKAITTTDENTFNAYIGGLGLPSGSGSGSLPASPFRQLLYAVNVTATTFQLALQPDGAPITTSGTQSGVHTLTVANSANRSSKIYYKTFLNGSDNTFNIVGEPNVLSFDWELDASLFIDYSAETISFVGTYGSGGSSTALTATASIASLNVDTELAIFFQYYVEPGSDYTLRATVCNTSDYATYVTINETLSPSAAPIISAWTITGNARDIYLEINSTSNPSLTTEDYTIASTFYSDESTRTPSGPVIAYSGVFWEYLQMGCAAFSQEISVSSDYVTIRNVGERAFDITNVAASPTVNPTSTLSGRQINIAYSNSYFVDGLIYDAEADGNNPISVQAGATTVTSVKHTVHPISVEQPTRYLATGTGSGAYFTGPLPDGTYFVVDSTGLPIAANQWEDYGGSVSVEIDHEDPSAIEITVVGPYVEIPSTTGPYTLAASDGENEFAALKIKGTGVYAGDNILGLLTGVDTVKYTRAIVNTITNPFISTVEQAYDRGVWAAQKASGPVVTMNANIPTSSISGIGLTCGSLVLYRKNTYRITSCSIGSVSSSINAERYVTVADVDALWSGQDVTDYDGVWGTYECQDQIIFPYKVA